MNESAGREKEAMWPLITVNILAFNRSDDVRITLNKIIRELDYPKDRLEIIVVDNASSDGTKEMVAGEFPGVKLIVNEINTGIAGWNRGFAAGAGDYFFVLDDDSAPVSGFKEAIRYLEQHEKVGILACNIIGGAFITEGTNFQPEQDGIGFIGCGAIIKRSVVEAIGGYADWIFLYTHEYEYGIRCLNQGYAIRYLRDCVVHHRASTVNRSLKRLITYTTRNELLIAYKYFPRKRVVFLLRLLLNHAINVARVEGLRPVMYVIDGFVQFLREAGKLDKTYVREEVQELYTNAFWHAEPLIPRLVNKMTKGLRKSKHA